MSVGKKLQLLVLSDPTSRQLSALKKLEELADITIGNSVDEVRLAVSRAEAVLFWDTTSELFHEVFPLCPNLKWVHSKNAGIESLVFPEFTASSVILTNSQGVYARTLAEFAITGMLYFAKDILRMNRNKGLRNWEQFEVEELVGKTLGIFGYGAIGQETAKRAKALGMKILAVRRYPEKSASAAADEEMVPLEYKIRLFKESDYILVAAPLTAETRGAIGKAELKELKKSAVVINLGRGPIIDEPTLLNLLTEQKIKGAVLDVFNEEPLPQSHPFWSLENILLSPHTADQTATWKDEAMTFFLENFERYAKNEMLLNICDKSLGY